MVTTAIRKNYLLKLLGKKLSDEQLELALHQIKTPVDSMEGDELQIEVTGDRPDLLSAEGIVRALKGHLGQAKGIPEEKFEKGNYLVNVDKSVSDVRPFIVAAVIENVKISDDDLKDLIQIQEKLTLTHGRKRKKVAIGLHNMDPVSPPFFYKAMDPASVSFVPLGKSQKMSMAEIVEKHEKGIDYAWTLEGLKKYPVIFDSRNEVLSFPPIINGILTELNTDTKNVFVDITGTDFHACNIALNIICQDFYDRGAHVKTVEIRYPDKSFVTPETAPEKMELSIEKVNKLIGLNLTSKQIIGALGKQRISAKEKDAKTIECLIPRYRADFIHWVDLAEEVALGYGYNNFEPKPPSVFTKGGLTYRTKLIDTFTDLMVGNGFLQVNAPILTSDRPFHKSHSSSKNIRIKNPCSEEYEVVRSELLPGLLDTLSKNTHYSYPQKIFEIGFVANENGKSETRADNELHLAGVLAHSEANLSELSGTLQSLLKFIKPEYDMHKTESPRFIAGRFAQLAFKNHPKSEPFLSIGEIHPAVLDNFKLEVPVVAFEINLEPLV